MWSVKIMGEGFPATWMVMFRFLIPVFQRFLCLFKCPTLTFSGTALLPSFTWSREVLNVANTAKVFHWAKWLALRCDLLIVSGRRLFQTQPSNRQNERQWFLLPVSWHWTESFVTLTSVIRLKAEMLQFVTELWQWGLVQETWGKIKRAVALKFIW